MNNTIIINDTIYLDDLNTIFKDNSDSIILLTKLSRYKNANSDEYITTYTELFQYLNNSYNNSILIDTSYSLDELKLSNKYDISKKEKIDILVELRNFFEKNQHIMFFTGYGNSNAYVLNIDFQLNNCLEIDSEYIEQEIAGNFTTNYNLFLNIIGSNTSKPIFHHYFFMYDIKDNDISKYDKLLISLEGEEKGRNRMMKTYLDNLKNYYGNYIAFTEYNDWEGEEWTFYILIDDNLIKFLKHFFKLSYIDGVENETYQINMDKVYNQTEVENIVNNTRSGYLDYDNGPFQISTEGLSIFKKQNTLDDFYKGGIENYF